MNPTDRTTGPLRGAATRGTGADGTGPDGTGPDATAVVTVRGLRKSYDGRVVVDGLDLDVCAGEVLGIIGANGAGKTTTVECLQGLRRPDAGTLRVLGLDPVTQGGRLRSLIGSQLQDSGLPARLKVEEAVELFAEVPASQGDALLERFGLDHRRRSPFGGLSGGERQRLFLVLALLNRPRLVILDELTQGLDPAARREVWSAVGQLREDGTTILLVTHELTEAQALCDRVVAMRAGRVLDAGSPAELVARHAQRATVRFTAPGVLSGDGRTADDDADDVRLLPGVQEVTRDLDRLTVHGDRAVIAHVGGWLVACGTVPPDLDVQVPDLESALVALLSPEADTAAGPVLDQVGAA